MVVAFSSSLSFHCQFIYRGSRAVSNQGFFHFRFKLYVYSKLPTALNTAGGVKVKITKVTGGFRLHRHSDSLLPLD